MGLAADTPDLPGNKVRREVQVMRRQCRTPSHGRVQEGLVTVAQDRLLRIF
ncbi:hypothetical protein I79_021105 [Cricetulus griseus]|uniref:Uncharacterized protein n=1 Tax=Cricetulus griseus TaxID=10029 RepID=G3IBS3_CRIGR|nr:hypothetical protein I79_021105 [Cricetulus griseus]